MLTYDFRLITMKIIIDGDYLKIKFSVIERILGIHGSFKIPVPNVRRVTTQHPVQSLKEIRLPGTFLPGVIKAGTYLTDRGKEFWYTTRKKEYLTIELENEFYKRIILSVDSSDRLKEKIDKIIMNK